MSAPRERGFMEVNPYAVTQSCVDDAVLDGPGLEARATRRCPHDVLAGFVVIND